MPKQIILLLSRELQALFLETRERTFRVMSLTKTLTKHLEGLLEKPTEVPSEKIGESLDKLKVN